MKGKKLLLAFFMSVSLSSCGAGREVGRKTYLSLTHRMARIPAEHMLPTIKPGDIVAIDESYYSSRPVERFDIPLFKNSEMEESTGEKDAMYVQRVIAVGGERMEIRRRELYVNGNKLSQPFQFTPHAPDEEFGQIIVPEGEYFLLGDNRPNSFDGRVFEEACSV